MVSYSKSSPHRRHLVIGRWLVLLVVALAGISLLVVLLSSFPILVPLSSHQTVNLFDAFRQINSADVQSSQRSSISEDTA
jgi:hypothetical protein